MSSRHEPMTLTADLVALVERFEPDPGPPPGETEQTPEELGAMADAILARREPGPLWLFAYGSLIWKPDFIHVDEASAVARGWHRSFCLELTRWRGTLELPALMMALDRGGSCTGVAYRLADNDHRGQVIQLLKRETDGNPPTNVARWIKMETGHGPMQALAFVANPAGRAYAGRLPHDAVARTLARAAGHWGSAAQYLYNTVSKLEEHGIRDRNLWKLQRLVAEQIQGDRLMMGRRRA
jgi:cation transport protein ChaC